MKFKTFFEYVIICVSSSLFASDTFIFFQFCVHISKGGASGAAVCVQFFICVRYDFFFSFVSTNPIFVCGSISRNKVRS